MATLISHQVTHTEAEVSTEVSDKVTDSEAGLSTEVFHQSTKPTDIVTETVTGSTEVSEKVTEREVKLSTEVTHPETESTEFSEKVTETNARHSFAPPYHVFVELQFRCTCSPFCLWDLCCIVDENFQPLLFISSFDVTSVKL